MAISSLTKRLRALFGEADSSSFSVATEVNRCFEKSMSINLDQANALSATANTALTHFWYAKRNITITEVKYVPDSATTANATNYAVLSLLSGNGTANAATACAALNTAATNIAEATPVALTISSGDIDAGKTLGVKLLKYGAGGVAVGEGHLVIHYIER